MQRRGTKESLEGIVGENMGEGTATAQTTGDEELVVEGIIETTVSSTSDFVSDSGLPIGIDTAIVRCIERYGSIF